HSSIGKRPTPTRRCSANTTSHPSATTIGPATLNNSPSSWRERLASPPPRKCQNRCRCCSLARDSWSLRGTNFVASQGLRPPHSLRQSTRKSTKGNHDQPSQNRHPARGGSVRVAADSMDRIGSDVVGGEPFVRCDHHRERQ